MSENSKKRQEIVDQLANALRKKEREGTDLGFFERLRDYVLSPKKSTWELVERAAVPSSNIEPKKFVLCFDYLNQTECNYSNFDSTKSKALVDLLAQITGCEVNQLGASRIVRSNIKNTPPYSSLFSRLTPDVELKETELPGGGRVFFFIIENKFNIVSIEGSHRSID